jgi:hypothetical protein
MKYRAAVCAAVFFVLASCADRRTSPPAARDSPQISFSDTAGCELAAVSAHPDGEALLREFVRRDAAGQFTTASPWFAAAVDCPGHEAAPAAVTMARDPLVRVISRAADSIRAEVRWDRLMVGDAAVPGSEVDTLTAVRTPFGWRVRSPALNPHIPIPPPPPNASTSGAPGT